MREILFRGKRIDNGEWIYGDFIRKWLPFGNRCINISDYKYRVIPETVGQYTGLTDKNGTKIFEGDIVSMRWFIPNIPFCEEYKRAKIYYDDYWNRYKMSLLDDETKIDIVGNCENMLVVGNIYDNPEFLKH